MWSPRPIQLDSYDIWLNDDANMTFATELLQQLQPTTMEERRGANGLPAQQIAEAQGDFGFALTLAYQFLKMWQSSWT